MAIAIGLIAMATGQRFPLFLQLQGIIGESFENRIDVSLFGFFMVINDWAGVVAATDPTDRFDGRKEQ